MPIAWDNLLFISLHCGHMVRRLAQKELSHSVSLFPHFLSFIVESAQVLLECGANPNAQNSITGATPLHCAIQSSKASSLERQIQTVQALVDAGADASRGDFFGSTPADYCEGDEALLELLRVEEPPVFCSIQTQNVQELELLLKEDASVVQSRHDSLTPLLYVVNMLVDDDSDACCCLELMRLLLEHGADPNEKPTANRNGHLNIQEDPGDAALHRICMAVKNEYYGKEGNTNEERVDRLKSAALLLIEYNATVSPTTQSLLLDAARRNQLEFLTFLIQEMAISPNIKGRQGMTPLHFAARSGKTEIVEFLLHKEGIDVEIQDDRGQTALDAARVNNKNDIVALLEQYKDGATKSNK